MWSQAEFYLGILLLVSAGCHREADVAQSRGASAHGPVIVFVAASTRDAVAAIAKSYSKEQKTEVKIDADDSSKLAVQIAAGAPAHLYLSANEEWAGFVKDKGLAQQTKVLLGNSLVIVVPKGNPAMIKAPKDLASGRVKRIGIAAPTVPAGRYATQALKNLKLWGDLQGKLVSGENVRGTLAYVERGEVDAGIVYATDAKISEKVETVYTFEPSSHEPIRYLLVLLKDGQESPGAQALFDYLQTPRAAAVFERYGFIFLAGK